MEGRPFTEGLRSQRLQRGSSYVAHSSPLLCPPRPRVADLRSSLPSSFHATRASFQTAKASDLFLFLRSRIFRSLHRFSTPSVLHTSGRVSLSFCFPLLHLRSLAFISLLSMTFARFVTRQIMPGTLSFSSSSQNQRLQRERKKSSASSELTAEGKKGPFVCSTTLETDLKSKALPLRLFYISGLKIDPIILLVASSSLLVDQPLSVDSDVDSPLSPFPPSTMSHPHPRTS